MTLTEMAQLALDELRASNGYIKARDQNKQDVNWQKTHVAKCENMLMQIKDDTSNTQPIDLVLYEDGELVLPDRITKTDANTICGKVQQAAV